LTAEGVGVKTIFPIIGLPEKSTKVPVTVTTDIAIFMLP
jgi:hypothetical protein